MFRVFDGRTANDVWLSIASAFNGGVQIASQSGRGGPTREILHAALSVSDPRQRWVTSRSPTINIAFALAETVWILSGREDSAFPNYFNRTLPRYAGTCDVYHGAYGHRLRRRFGMDQLERAYQALSQDSESRQVVLQIWDGRADLPLPNGQPAAPDIPCNIVALLKVRDGALEWTQVMRSNDVFRGLPYNFVQFTIVQEIVAGWLSARLGTYNHISDSLHIYETDFEQTMNWFRHEVSDNPDSLALPKSQFDCVLQKLEQKSDLVPNETVQTETLLQELKNCEMPQAYLNILCVLFAEGVRKRKCYDAIPNVMETCTNPVFKRLYQNWLSRLGADFGSITDRFVHSE